MTSYLARHRVGPASAPAETPSPLPFPSPNRAARSGLLALLLAAIPAGPALALPGLDVSAGLGFAYDLGAATGTSPFGADLDAYVGTPIVKASGHLLTIGRGSIGEGVIRFEPLPLPFVYFRPGIGYQGGTLLGTGSTSFDHMPYGSLAFGVGVPLVPVSADAEIGASYSFSRATPHMSYSANVNFFPIPLLPVALGARYRGYSTGAGLAPGLHVVGGGLRVTL